MQSIHFPLDKRHNVKIKSDDFDLSDHDYRCDHTKLKATPCKNFQWSFSQGNDFVSQTILL